VQSTISVLMGRFDDRETYRSVSETIFQSAVKVNDAAPLTFASSAVFTNIKGATCSLAVAGSAINLGLRRGVRDSSV
jgi:hypothetical protein